jgi:hypothetical protein
MITSLVGALSLETDIDPCLRQIGKAFEISDTEFDQLFPKIINSFRYLSRFPLPNTYKKARYINDVRIVPLHMTDISVWSLSISQIQRMFTSPSESDLVWLEKIEAIEKSPTYQELYINESENGRPVISFYF